MCDRHSIPIYFSNVYQHISREKCRTEELFGAVRIFQTSRIILFFTRKLLKAIGDLKPKESRRLTVATICQHKLQNRQCSPFTITTVKYFLLFYENLLSHFLRETWVACAVSALPLTAVVRVRFPSSGLM